MPSLDMYKKMYSAFKNDGEARKHDSDKIIEATWYEDIATRTCWFFDWYHDDNKEELNDLTIDKSNMYPMDIKYLVNSSQTYSKDNITYHLQMKPSQKCVVPYYDEIFKNRYNAKYPCGLYCLIPDEKGLLNRWLVVAEANYNDPQFPTFELLRCDKVIKFVYKGMMYNVPGVLRRQNSYNAGVWADNVFTTSEDQYKFVVPLNRETEKIWYNQRIIIDNNVITEPRAWNVTKVNRVGNNGLALITCAQSEFDEHKDAFECEYRDDKYILRRDMFYIQDIPKDAEVIGIWADYYGSKIPPVEPKIPELIPSKIYSKISYSGAKPEIKSGGSYKKITVDFFDENNSPTTLQKGDWVIEIRKNGKICNCDNIEDLVTVLKPDNTISNNIVIGNCQCQASNSTDLKENQIKIKFNRDDMYIGHTMLISYVCDDQKIKTSSIELEIVGL